MTLQYHTNWRAEWKHAIPFESVGRENVISKTCHLEHDLRACNHVTYYLVRPHSYRTTGPTKKRVGMVNGNQDGRNYYRSRDSGPSQILRDAIMWNNGERRFELLNSSIPSTKILTLDLTIERKHMNWRHTSITNGLLVERSSLHYQFISRSI
jgi:hypothetical protein